MQAVVEIFFSDLTEEAKSKVLKAFSTSEELENWEDMPLAVLCRDLKEEEDEP